jgi:hypothetical protein
MGLCRHRLKISTLVAARTQVDRRAVDQKAHRVSSRTQTWGGSCVEKPTSAFTLLHRACIPALDLIVDNDLGACATQTDHQTPILQLSAVECA